MRKSHRCAFAIAVICTTAGCGSNDGGPATENVAGSRTSVMGGTISDRHKEGVLLDIDTTAAPTGCTGALVAPTVVLTARHCFQNDDGTEFVTGVHVAAPYAKTPNQASGTAYLPHPTLDAALLFTNAGIATTFPQIAGSAVPDGTNVEVVGRIFNDTMLERDLVVAPTTISIADTSTYTGLSLLQCGDSGGPVYAIDDPRTIVAINDAITNTVFVDGQPSCKVTNDTSSIYLRVDTASLLSDWITTGTANPSSPDVRKISTDPAPATGGCGAIDFAGTCNGEVLSYCDSGTLTTIDCAAQGGTCGPDDTGSNCLYAGDACGSATFQGSCSGDVLTWCDGGAINSVDCSATGQSCGFNDQGGFYDCL